MKYLFFTFIVLVQLGTINRVHASAVAGALEPTQILNLAELGGINLSDAATAISTDLEMVDTTIFRPLQTALITAAQQEAANQIIGWVNGGTQSDSLIIANPEKYIRDQGITAVKGAIKNIPVDSAYGGTIFQSILDQYQDAGGIKEKLAALSQSNIPSVIQENMCDDSSLTNLALQDVQDATGNYVASELATRKAELFNYACNGDPETDPDLAARLEDLNDQNPSIGGWDSWLAITGGDNEFTHTQKSLDAAEEYNATREDLATKEIYDQAGPISQTVCDNPAQTGSVGGVAECLGDILTINPGEVVSGALNNAANAGIDRLTNLMEGGFSDLLISVAINKLSSGINSSLSGMSTTNGTSNTASTVNSNSTPRQDLLGNTQAKSNITGPMQRMFDSNNDKFSSLDSLDRSYLGEINAYGSKIDAGRACYDNLIQTQVAVPTDPQVIEAYAFYDDRQKKIDAAKAIILPELAKIAEAKKLMADTIAAVNNSNSTTEISTIYTDYINKMDNGNYPTTKTEGIRKGQYSKDKSEAKSDQENIDKYNNTCIQKGGPSNTGSFGA
jgi:hypothetical protein